RIFQLTYVSSNTFVTFTALTCRPAHSFTFTYCVFPLWGNFRQVVGPAKGCTGTVRTVNHNDVVGWQVQVRVQRFNRFVVPLSDFSHVDVSDNRARQTQLTRFDTVDVYNRYCTANDCRELQQVIFVQRFSSHRVIRCTEVYSFSNNLLL